MNPFSSSRIRPESLRIDEKGVVRIALATPARPIFEAIFGLGEALHLCNNAALTFGCLEPFPALTDWSNEVFPSDQARRLKINLAEIAGISATHESIEIGPVYSFELYQPDGLTTQKIVLTSDSSLDLFSAFVADHQTPWDHLQTWAPANHSASLSHRRTLRWRIPYLRYREASMDANLRQLPAGFTDLLFAELSDREISCRLTFYSSSVIRTVTTDSRFECRLDQLGALESVMGNVFSLHFRAKSVASAWLHSGRCPCCGDLRCTVELGDSTDHLSLAISAASKSQENEWRGLMEELFDRMLSFSSID